PTPLAAPRDARFVQNEKKSLPRPAPRPTAASENTPGWGWFFRIALYLCGLSLLAWGGLALARRYLPGSSALFTSPAIEILGRANLDPRRYVALIRVGRRVLLVGVGPEQLSHLTSIANPEEVAEILETAKPRTAVGKSLFQRLFTKYLARANHENHTAQALANIEKLTADLTELRQRVRTLRQAE
ncbi:MAG: flagellar biosynthetic protein FliO, partial [Planctomycetota bacterium]|nr:flagellar biosynthetic protein FliO [Planctomycetota bacterium]